MSRWALWLLVSVAIASTGVAVLSAINDRACEEARGTWEPLRWTCRLPPPVIIQRDLHRVDRRGRLFRSGRYDTAAVSRSPVARTLE